MGSVQTSADQNDVNITGNTNPVNITPSIQDPQIQEYQDIDLLIITNASSTGSLVTLSDGTNNYHFYAPANDTRAYGISLVDSTPNTAWTAQVAQGGANIYIDLTWSVRN